MPKDHGKSKRKSTGGRLTRHQKKRKYELSREQTHTEIGEHKTKKIQTRGGNEKIRTLKTNKATVTDTDTGESETVHIENVLENKANQHFVRRNIITKGAIIQTSKGKAKVKNRPGQEGTVNAILLKN